jgi:hypothetical protein
MECGGEHFDRALRQHVLEPGKQPAALDFGKHLDETPPQRLCGLDAGRFGDPCIPRTHLEVLVGRKDAEGKTIR